MTRRSITIAFCILGLSSAASAANSPGEAVPMSVMSPAYSTLYFGQKPDQLETAFQNFFDEGFREGPSIDITGIEDQAWEKSAYFLTAVRALRGDFGFELDIDNFQGWVSDSSRMRYGMRFTEPAGKRALPKGAASLLANFASVSAFDVKKAEKANRALLALSAVCNNKEQSYNEKIVSNVTRAKIIKRSKHRVLEWMAGLHDAGCIRESFFRSKELGLAKASVAILDSLESTEKVRALFVLTRFGHGHLVRPQDIAWLLEQQPKSSDRERTPLFQRQDLMLASAYVCAYLLIQSDPAEPRVAMLDVVKRMRGKGMARNGEALDKTIQGMLPLQSITTATQELGRKQ